MKHNNMNNYNVRIQYGAEEDETFEIDLSKIPTYAITNVIKAVLESYYEKDYVDKIVTQIDFIQNGHEIQVFDEVAMKIAKDIVQAAVVFESYLTSIGVEGKTRMEMMDAYFDGFNK